MSLADNVVACVLIYCPLLGDHTGVPYRYCHFIKPFIELPSVAEALVWEASRNGWYFEPMPPLGGGQWDRCFWLDHVRGRRMGKLAPTDPIRNNNP